MILSLTSEILSAEKKRIGKNPVIKHVNLGVDEANEILSLAPPPFGFEGYCRILGITTEQITIVNEKSFLDIQYENDDFEPETKNEIIPVMLPPEHDKTLKEALVEKGMLPDKEVKD